MKDIMSDIGVVFGLLFLALIFLRAGGIFPWLGIVCVVAAIVRTVTVEFDDYLADEYEYRDR